MKWRLLCQRVKNLQRKMMIKKNLKVKQKIQVPNKHNQKVKKSLKFLLHLHHHRKVLNLYPVHLARKLLQRAQSVLSKLLPFLLGLLFPKSAIEEASPCPASLLHLKEILTKQEDPDEDLFHREDPDLNQHSQEDPGQLPAQSLRHVANDLPQHLSQQNQDCLSIFPSLLACLPDRRGKLKFHRF